MNAISKEEASAFFEWYLFAKHNDLHFPDWKKGENYKVWPMWELEKQYLALTDYKDHK